MKRAGGPMSSPVPAKASKQRNKPEYTKAFPCLSSLLPVYIPTEDLDNFPKFAELLKDLSHRLSVHGISELKQKSLELSKQNLNVAKQKWLMNQIVYFELGELLSDLNIRDLDGALSLDEKQLRDILTKALTYAEIEDYLHFPVDPTKTSTLFGLSREDVKRNNPVRHHLSALQHTVAPMVEERLKKKCEEIYMFYDTQRDKDGQSSGLLLAQAQALPARVECDQQDLEQEAQTVREIRLKRDQQFWIYYQKLLECLSLMETMIEDFKLTAQVNIDDTTVNLLKARCDALCLKVRLNSLKILCDTYTSETVKALQKIGGHLNTATIQTERELASTTQSLESYHAIGLEFQSLAGQFSQLQKEIDNKEWALRHLGSLQGEGGDRATSGASATTELSGDPISAVGMSEAAVVSRGNTDGLGQERPMKKVSYHQLFDKIEEIDESSPT